ncbi:MAG TPA: hypothetical protein VFV87_10175 [Pirellulaceae bacterium]|nr:hypothetical protein [Pirellulaceae bacterium]
MTQASPTNPYEAPREPVPRSLPDFSDREAAELADLRRRVMELEKQVGNSWFVRGGVLRRVLAVWAYLLLGYGVMLAVVFGIMAIISAVTGEWP